MTASLNPYISQFGEEFDAEKSSQYRMTIQYALGGLSYALLDTETYTLVALECFQSTLLADSDDLFRTLERALESKGLNNKAFQSVKGLVDNRFCTLVPTPLFNEADQAKYLDFAFQVPENYVIASEPLVAVPSINVFAQSKTLQDRMLAKWKDVKFAHSSTVFINSAMESDTETGVFVHVRNRDFDMVIKKEGKLFFFNNFKFNTKEDFAYFLMFAMEQNGFSGHDIPVTFSGLIRPASEIVDLCGRYVKDIRFVADPHVLKVSKALDEVPFQYYQIHYQALK
ncbi:MAG: DUF3822 family protein [Bacteroidales bacterium]|nr:DUF3822 family protein [Bacteroidales bacterium]